MKTPTLTSSQPARAARRGFRWTVHSTEARWIPHADAQAALDGSSDGCAGCAVTPVPATPRRRSTPRIR